jgi:hypothetical protein
VALALGLFEITQIRHSGVLFAGVQQFKELDFRQNLSRQVSGREACLNDQGGISCFVVTLGVTGVGGK